MYREDLITKVASNDKAMRLLSDILTESHACQIKEASQEKRAFLGAALLGLGLLGTVGGALGAGAGAIGGAISKQETAGVGAIKGLGEGAGAAVGTGLGLAAGLAAMPPFAPITALTGGIVGDRLGEQLATWLINRRAQKTASLHKEALQTVNDVKAEQMKKMHVGSSSIKNYADQRDANMPAWYNPIDWLMNWKRYVRNDLQFEKNRDMLMNRSNDRYWKQMDELAKRQATPPQGK